MVICLEQCADSREDYDAEDGDDNAVTSLVCAQYVGNNVDKKVGWRLGLELTMSMLA